MAHIKVQRRSMRPEEYIMLRYGWLKRHIYEEKNQISNIFIREAHQTAENSFEFYDSDYHEIKNGDIIYSPDGSAFFKFSFVMPNKKNGDSALLYMKTSSEIIVKVNEKYAGGFDPNRCTVDVAQFAENNVCNIKMLGFNRSKPDDERNPETSAGRGCRQEFTGIYTVFKNKDVAALCYDCEVLTDIMNSELFSEEYRKIITQRLNAALSLIDFDSKDLNPNEVTAALLYIENNIYADKTFKGSGKAALIAHSHLDIAYYWRRIHSVQKNLRTVLIQLRLMDKYPDFTYCHTQPYIYETLEKYYPDVFNELKARVKEGRFEPVGAMYVEPDCNIPCCESLIRQCLYGQLFYREKFNMTVDTCFLPDVFGNSWILPQILKKSGVKYFVSNKMSTWNDTNRFPHNTFLWRGADTSEVFASVPPTHFIAWNEPSQVAENWDAYLDKNTGTETLSMFGYGDGGSGATEEMIELMHRFNKLSVMPQTRHITAERYLEENFASAKNLSVWDGELYLEMHRGTFTTKSELKRLNRRLEQKFRDAEIISLARFINGSEYPHNKIKELYKRFLVNQFHDILPGSHIAPVYRDAINDLTAVNNGLDEILNLQGDYQGDYFNTLNFERNKTEFIENPNGYFTRCGKNGSFCRVSFNALSGGKIIEPEKDSSWIISDGLNAETDVYKVVFANDGSIISLYDKALEREWVKGEFNKLCLYDDKPGNYDAWDILPDYADKKCELFVKTPLHFVKADSECAEFECVLSTEKSVWTLKIRLFRSLRDIEVESDVDWNEKHKLMKVNFEPEIVTRELVCDTSAGYIKRETHRNTSMQQARFECCTHKWFNLDEGGGGVAVINDGKYGVGIGEKTVSLSLLRATERPDPFSDIGKHSFCWKILPHAGSFIDADVNKNAIIYNSPLIKTEVKNLPSYFCANGVYLQCAKLSEDQKTAVLRFCEQNGARGSIYFGQEVKVLNLLEDVEYTCNTVSFKPFEIITVGIDINK